MAALCYPCNTKVATLSVSWATKNDPVGCCKLCHVLACGLHGTRVASGPTFICVECQPSLLTASAASLIDNKDNMLQYLEELFSMIPKEWLYKSFDDFKKKNPHYEKWIEGAENSQLNWQSWPYYNEFKFIFQNASFNASQLLVAAALILKKLYNGEFPEDYPDYLIKLSQSLDDNNLNTNNEREVFVTG